MSSQDEPQDIDPDDSDECESEERENQVRRSGNSIPEIVDPPDPEEEKGGKATFYGYQGPIPDPEHLQQYEKILPGAAERLITLAETNLSSRVELSRRELDIHESHIKFNHEQITKGQKYGFILSCVMVVAGVIIALVGPPETAPIVGGILGGTPIAGVITSFLVSSKKKKSNDPDEGDE